MRSIFPTLQQAQGVTNGIAGIQKHATASTSLSADRMLYAIKCMLRIPEFAIFAEPVNWNAMGLLDYPTIVKHPMDFRTLTQYCQSPKFDFQLALEYFRLIWANAIMYNREDSMAHALAKNLADISEKKIASIQTNAHLDDSNPKLQNAIRTTIMAIRQLSNVEHFLVCNEYGIGLNRLMIEVNFYKHFFDLQEDVEDVFATRQELCSSDHPLNLMAADLRLRTARLIKSFQEDMDKKHAYLFHESPIIQQLYCNLAQLTPADVMQVQEFVKTKSSTAFRTAYRYDLIQSDLSLQALNMNELIMLDTFVRKLLKDYALVDDQDEDEEDDRKTTMSLTTTSLTTSLTTSRNSPPLF